MYQHRDVNEIEQQLNNDFGNGSLTINEAYTLQRIKPNLFFLQVIVKFYLHVKYKNVKIKQHSLVTYRGCVLDETLCGEPMALKALNKINGKLKFLYRKNKLLPPTLHRMLCNAIIQPYFDYICSAWYPNLNERLKKKIQVAQNKSIWFCLKLDKRHHIYSKEFESIKWLPVNKRVHQCINAITFKLVNNSCPHYLNEVYEYIPQCRIESRSNLANLKAPFRKTNMGQNGLS